MIHGAETTLYATLSTELDNMSGQYLEDCTIKSPSKIAYNMNEQNHLWEVTLGLLEPWLTNEVFNHRRNL